MHGIIYVPVEVSKGREIKEKKKSWGPGFDSLLDSDLITSLQKKKKKKKKKILLSTRMTQFEEYFMYYIVSNPNSLNNVKP